MRSTPIAMAAIVSFALAVPAFAQGNSNGHGHGGGPPPGHGPAGHSSGASSPSVVMIPDHDRMTINSYYRTEYSAGRCPPGLAKKDNGCLPPGQAKKMWQVGQPLPAGIAYEVIPVGGLSPPAGYQYVRVANDILMMAVGTRLIAGAVADLSSF